MGSHCLAARELERLLGRSKVHVSRTVGTQLKQSIESSLQLAQKLVPCEAGAVAVGTSLRTLRYAAAFGSDAEQLLSHESEDVQHLFKETVGGNRNVVVLKNPTPEPQFVNGSPQQTDKLVLTTFVHSPRIVGVLQLSNPEHEDTTAAKVADSMGLVADQLAQSISMILALDKQQHLASRDPLTGTGNVRTLYRDLDRVIHQAQQRDEDMAVMFVDLDRLKRVNTRLGHGAGSETLKRTAKAIRKALPYPGQVYRFGGDEFVVVMPHVERDDALDLADELREAVADGTKGIGDLPRTTVSIGVATLRTALKQKSGNVVQVDAAARLMTAADRALYRAKDAGRNRTIAANRKDDRLR